MEFSCKKNKIDDIERIRISAEISASQLDKVFLINFHPVLTNKFDIGNFLLLFLPPEFVMITIFKNHERFAAFMKTCYKRCLFQRFRRYKNTTVFRNFHR